MPGTLDGGSLRQWFRIAAAALERARPEIDDLNVFPVPDGDTGTNLALTAAAAAAATGLTGRREFPAGMVARAAADAALLAARGNSGGILSAWLCGLADALADAVAVDGRLLGRALDQAATRARSAVATPVEGTILTVARGAADAAVASTGSVAAVATGAAEAARDALRRTPSQLPALEAAGVVDAGGRGLVLVLEALVTVAGGAAAPAGTPTPRRRRVPAAAGDGYAYEVQYLLDVLDRPDQAVPALRAALAAVGGSVVVTGRGARWSVHVHVDDVGAAIEAGIRAGRPAGIAVTRFADRIAGGGRAGRAVVAVAPGEGLGGLLAAEGAVIVGRRSVRGPSVRSLSAAISATGAAEVVVLPDSADLRPVAEAAAEMARDEGLAVAVVPTMSAIQGLAAIAVHDPASSFAADVIAMTAAARSTRWAEVTVATGRALTSAGVCKAGDVLGLIEGDVVLLAADVLSASTELVDRLLMGGGELVTLVTGADAPPELGQRLAMHLRTTRPAVEVVSYDGGQPRYPLLAGVE